MPLTIKMTFKAEASDSVPDGLYRVLHIVPEKDEVTLIPITNDCKGWLIKHSFRALNEELEPSDKNKVPGLKAVTVEAPSIHALSDEEITKRYPPQQPDDGEKDKKITPEKKKKLLSPPIQAREDRMKLIRSLIYVDGETRRPREELFEDGFIAAWIKQQVQKLGRNVKSQCYTCLRFYFMWGETENALLGGHPACGGKGKERAPSKPNSRCGRRNALFCAGMSDNPGFSVAGNDAEKARIQAFCAGKGIKDGPVEAWYNEYLGVFHHRSIHIVDNQEVVELKPDHEMPTLDQFRYWGNKADRMESAWIKRLTACEYEQKHLPRFGSANDGLSRFGQMATLDLTSADVQLTSIESKLKPAGVGNRIPVLDIFLNGWTYGVHNFYGRHSQENAMLALFIAFTSKKWLGERLGLHFLNDENFPPIVPEAIFVDHDEFFTQEAKVAARNAGLNLIFPEPKRGIRKPTVESDHRSAHAKTGHRVTGTTRGHRRKDGEPEAIIDSCWNIVEFMRADWRHRYIRNCVEHVAPEVITMEMRADNLHKEPTRINIVNWLMKNGYAKCSTADPVKLLTFLLPKIRARATPEGVFLLRPDRGNADECIKFVKYVYPLDLYQKWFGGPSKKVFDIVVRYNPYDPATIFFVDPDIGVQAFHAKWHDPALVNVCMEDLLRMKDEALHISLQNRHETLTAKVNFTLQMKADDMSARAQKQAELEALPKKPTKKSMRQGVKETQEAEKKKCRDLFMPPELKPSKKEINHEEDAKKPADRQATSANPIKEQMRKTLKKITEEESS